MEKRRSCLLFLFEGYADWEPSLAIAGLRSYSDFEIKTFSADGNPVISMGGLSVKPDFKLADVNDVTFDLLMLPGGNAWEEGGNMEISEFVTNTFHSGKTVAGICAATTFLAKLGLYHEIKHTSNGFDYLKKQVPSYVSENNYINEPCVSDKNLITANGAAMIEFAYTIFNHFSILDQRDLAFWLSLYKSAGMNLTQP
jgi:putative intracellular protease/amidase